MSISEFISTWQDVEFDSADDHLFTYFVNDLTGIFNGFTDQYGIRMTKRMAGWFIVSYFVRRADGKCVYISIPDVRFNPLEWRDNILYREAENEDDYRGKTNHYTKLTELANAIRRL